jgi:hypothetical protein
MVTWWTCGGAPSSPHPRHHCKLCLKSRVALLVFMEAMSAAGGTSSVRSKVALITGITGQDGSYLAELLLCKVCRLQSLQFRSVDFAI